MLEQSNDDQRELLLEHVETCETLYEDKLNEHNHHRCIALLQLLKKRRYIVIWSVLVIISLALIGISSSLKWHKLINKNEQVSIAHTYHSDSGTFSCSQPSNIGFGYPAQLIGNLVRTREISFVFPVYDGHRGLLVNLLRSIRNLCIDCTEVPIIIITDDASKKAIYESVYNDTSPYPSEPTAGQSFPKLSIKLLRDVMPYYAVNGWNDNSLQVNGKFLIQSHKKMFGVLNGATTRFSWVMDVDSFFFRPMSLTKVLRTYLSSPYILTTSDWSGGQDLYDVVQNVTGSFLATGYTIEVMHWIYDREIVSDLNKMVLAKYPTWNVPILFKKRYFFEMLYYHFIMSSQIQHRKYMQYKVVEIRTLFGGNQSPLLQAIMGSANGGLIERIGNSITKLPNIYDDVADIWTEMKIPVFRPDGDEVVLLDFALDTHVVIMTNNFRDGLYRMSQSGYWTNQTDALKNAEKQGWKPLADHLKIRYNTTGMPILLMEDLNKE